MFSIEALERGIEKCKQNIKIFEDAADKERETIKEYRKQIDILERKNKALKKAKSRVHIEIDNGG